MLTLGQLAGAINQLPREFGQVEVRLVLGVRESDRGPFEGATVMQSAPVAGLCVGKNGMFLFIEQNKAAQREEPLPNLPPTFTTGDKDYDERRKELGGGGEEPGEEWKKG
jgi:hypothetical protein